MKSVRSPSRDRVYGLLLVMLTWGVYWQVSRCDFINLDDNLYISENPEIRNGICPSGLAWAFSSDLLVDSRHSDYWQPVTWISRMIDISIFGLNPGAHHLVNLGFHTLNVLLLFQILLKMTQNAKRSAMVAALFAIHPLNVESVAWVTERKDVLGGFFWMLTLWAYLNFLKRPGHARYSLILLSFGLGLMSKPMLITLPFVLLLLDYWPLQRAKIEFHDREKWKHLLFEKIPLFAMSVTSMGITWAAQQSHLEQTSMGFAIKHALLSYVKYLNKALFPSQLAVYYPHTGKAPWFEALGAALILGCVFFGVFRNFRKRPYLLVGWCWFIGTLIPVMGLNDIEGADRFTYLPLIGLFILLVWGGSNIFSRMKLSRFVPNLVAACILLGLMVLTYIQVGYWRNSITLFKHALDVTQNNTLAHNNLGVALKEDGRIDEAICEFQKSIKINSDYGDAWCNLGLCLGIKGDLERAVQILNHAIQLKPDEERTWNNLGTAFTFQGKIDAANKYYRQALSITPNSATAHFNLGNNLLQQKNVDQAAQHFAQAIQWEPEEADSYYKLALCMALQAKPHETQYFLDQAAEREPDTDFTKKLEIELKNYRSGIDQKNGL